MVNAFLVDTDVIIALIKRDDTNHKRAVQIVKKLRSATVSLAMTNYVFSEVVTILSQRVSRNHALKFIVNCNSPSSSIALRRIDQQADDMAIEIFRRQTSKNTSYVDCANIAVVKLDKFSAILSFDHVYVQNGLDVVS